MEVITIRIDKEHLKDLKEIEKQEKSDRAAVTRRLLASAIQEWKINSALTMIRAGRITYRKAVEMIGCTYAELLNLMEKRNISIGYTSEDLKRDIAR